MLVETTPAAGPGLDAVWVLRSGVVGRIGAKVALPDRVFKEGKTKFDTLLVFRKGYQEVEEEVVLYKGIDNVQSIELSPTSPRLVFLSEPLGVQVSRMREDGVKESFGVTPFSGTIDPPLRDGETIYWEKSDYEAVTTKYSSEVYMYRQPLHSKPRAVATAAISNPD